MPILLQPFSTPSVSPFLALPAPKIAGFLPAPRIAGLLPANVESYTAAAPLRASRIEILFDDFPTYDEIVQAVGPIRTREEMNADLLAIWNAGPRRGRRS